MNQKPISEIAREILIARGINPDQTMRADQEESSEKAYLRLRADLVKADKQTEAGQQVSLLRRRKKAQAVRQIEVTTRHARKLAQEKRKISNIVAWRIRRELRAKTMPLCKPSLTALREVQEYIKPIHDSVGIK